MDLVTIGIAAYPNLTGTEVSEATEGCRDVAKTLAANGVSVYDWSAYAATKETIEPRLAEWCQKRGTGSILYWCGHAEQTEDGYRVILGNAAPPMLLHVLRDDDFAQYLQFKSTLDYEHPGDWVLLILDTCASGLGAWRIYKKLATSGRLPPRNVGVIGTSNGAAPTQAGQFPKLLAEKIIGFTTNDEHISVRELVRRLEDTYEATGDDAPHIWSHFAQDARIPHPHGGAVVQATQDSYTELERVLREASPEVRNHFYAAAQGTDTGQLAWHFRGRNTERGQIVAWLKSVDAGMLILTGLAGSGKSAVLGMILAASDPQILEALRDLGYPPMMPSLRPPPGTFTAVAHLSGRTIRDVTSHLATQLGHPQTADPEQLIQAIDIAGPITILADALDEARDPYPIANLLRRLASLDRVKVVVGTRQSLHEDPDHPKPRDRALLDALGAPRGPSEDVVKLERDQTAIRYYVSDRLNQGLPTEMPDRNATIDRLSTAIAGVDQPFLFARLAVHEVIADPQWQDPAVDLMDLLSHGHTGIFDRAVDRIRTEKPPVEALLHSLAYAQGNGYSRTDGIWAIAATALLNEDVTDEDISQALKLAAPYIMLDSEFGSSTYRLAHRTYAERYIQLDTPT